ncbi:MAG: hypothetical protein RIT27_415 [Pseudomonadota bacterium]|jgi:SAM-dependent methyltransferase
MKQQPYCIKFPASDTEQLEQDEAYFHLKERQQEIKLRFHDYGEIYKRPNLYEQLFYDRLKCSSPQKAKEILSQVLRNNRVEMTELRVLDLGAGNGMVGEILDVARMIGVDISKEAYLACERDRPAAYDAYYVADLCHLENSLQHELLNWQLDCLICIAALGFGDIPIKAFATAFNCIQSGGWIVFNIKETFLQESDVSGFSRLVKHLLTTDILEIHHLERYRHRISIDGKPLFYYMLVGKKSFDISSDVLLNFE